MLFCCPQSHGLRPESFLICGDATSFFRVPSQRSLHRVSRKSHLSGENGGNEVKSGAVNMSPYGNPRRLPYMKAV